MILLVAIAGGCPPDDEVDEKPPITGIEIVPWQVAVGSSTAADTRFELEARLWTGAATDRRSITESQGYTLDWTANRTWATVESRTGFRAILKVAKGTPPGSAVVTVKAGGKTAEAEIIVPSSGLTGQDAVAATYSPDRVPDAVVVNGERSATTLPCVSLAAFVRQSALDALVDRCAGDDPGWEAAVLAEDHQMVLTRVQWTFAPDPKVQAGSLQGSPRSIPVAVRVMVGPGALGATDPAALQTEALTVAEADVEVVNSLMMENRVGVKLRIDKSEKIPSTSEVDIPDCPTGDALTGMKDDGHRLHIYYVNSLHGKRGRTCGRHEGRKHEVIYVAYRGQVSPTLAHEVGHALGLTLPGKGHADLVGGLDRTNLMTGGENDYNGGRRRLTVGQAFRMNADSASWLNWATDPPDGANSPVRESTAPRVACQCGKDDPPGPCPRLGEDVARPSERADGVQDWQCYDLLQILVPEAESPVAVVAGQSWRGTCRSNLPGRNHGHGSGAFVQFENLTRPGSCDSWAALFFRQRGVVFLPLAEPAPPAAPTLLFSQGADMLLMSDPDPVPARIKVTVHTYYDPVEVESGTVKADVEHALQTFGVSNRSGIELVFDENTADSCPQTDPGPHEVNLCYASTGADEAGLTVPRRVTVHLPNRTPTTVSHFLGQAFDLPVVATGGPGLPNNVMHAAPASRGQVLTLSQVFRINGYLNPSLCAARTCPTLSDGVAP